MKSFLRAFISTHKDVHRWWNEDSGMGMGGSFQDPQRVTRSRFKARGQVMLLSVLALGATMLGVTTIAGLLMIFQLRQTTNLADSAKAIYAADAGIEWAFYDFTCNVDPADEKACIPLPAFTNGASVTVTNDGSSIKSVGSAGKASRAFLITF